MKINDRSLPLTADCSCWPFYPPFEVKYSQRKSEPGVNATLEMYAITAEHKFFTLPALNFRGPPVGNYVRKVVATGITPRLNTGVAHKPAGVGQVGAGLVRPPMAIFEAALPAYAEQYGLD